MEQFNLFSQTQLALFVTKTFFLVASFLFTVFLIVVARQVFSMNTIVHDTHDEFILKAASIALFIASLSLFLTAIVIL